MDNVVFNVFCLFFAVAYGAMLAGLGRLQSFTWVLEWEEKGEEKKTRETWWQGYSRIFLCFALCNLGPVIMFGWAFTRLHGSTDGFCLWFRVPCAALASLGVFLPYRVFHLVARLLQEQNCWPRLRLYGPVHYDKAFGNEAGSPWWHLLAVGFYLTVFVVCVRLAAA
jgi:hypothetical protein